MSGSNSTRSRARQSVMHVKGGGGGGSGASGTVGVGPDYGEGSGNDGLTQAISVETDLTALELTSQAGSLGLASDLGALEATYPAGGKPAFAMDPNYELEMTADPALDHVEDNFLRMTLGAAEDSYIEQNNPNTNYGGFFLLVAKALTPVVNDASHAIFAWDFSDKILDHESTLDLSLDFVVSHNVPLSALNCAWELYSTATQPFDESTVTWNTAPNVTNLFLRDAGTVSVAAGANQTVTINPQTNWNPFGAWVYIRFLGDSLDAAGTNRFSFQSKESASPPSLTVEVKYGSI